MTALGSNETLEANLPAKGSLLLPGLCLTLAAIPSLSSQLGTCSWKQGRSTDSEDKESQLFLYSHECHDTGGGYQGRNDLK